MPDTTTVVLAGPDTTTVTMVDEEVTVVVATEGETVVVATGTTGPQGPTGPPGPSSSTREAIAGTVLSSHRVVSGRADGKMTVLDPSILADLHRPPSLSTTAALADAAVTVLDVGYVEEATWAWTPGELLFCGTAGVLTQTAPAGVFLLVVGEAITATSIMFRPHQPIRL